MILHAETGWLRCRKPSSVWSFRLMCVSSTSLGLERIRIHRETVVVRGDLHFTRHCSAPDDWRRDVRTSACRSSAQRQPENLMPQADAENRPRPSACELARPDCSGSGSPGTIGRNTPSGSSASTSSAEVLAGTTVTWRPTDQPPQNVALDSKVVGHHVAARFAGIAAMLRRRARLHALIHS